MRRVVVISWGPWAGAVALLVAAPLPAHAATAIAGMQVSATVLPTCVVSVAAIESSRGKTAPSVGEVAARAVRAACSAGVSHAVEVQGVGAASASVASTVRAIRPAGGAAPILVTISY